MERRNHRVVHWISLVGIFVVLIACNILPEQTATPVGEPATIVAPTLPPDVEPTPHICEASVVEQSYEHGFMFWVGRTLEEKCKLEHSFAIGSGEIWVAIFDESEQGGEWLIFVDEWNEAQEPEVDPTLTPPADLMQPVRGFGKVWRDLLTEQQREELGWATATELPVPTEYRYEGSGFVNTEGEFIPRPGRHVLKGLAGDLFTFDETSQTFDYTPPTE